MPLRGASAPATAPPGAGHDLQAETARRQAADIEAASAATANLPVVIPTVVPGRAAQVLTALATAADLLVVGSHGHGRLETRLLGTVSSNCIRWAACPVVVIPPAHDPGRPAHEEPSGAVITTVMY